ncbi:CCA tRNA nucleotidyltransferase [Roseovarius salinarum]|uniref:CCA tRNA nucleotidyltransferase n=1 Tax=Roseovarius salinarum TaxID=1981892 RepID=UPI000C34465F|nr:CCA tRNA nucleotidyltransferase [Roseovarius salinarum]
MRISGDWIAAEETQAVCRALTDAGFQALFVGGCVRNALLDVRVDDIDIATDAHPETVMDLARAAGMKPVPTGIDHGTVTVVSQHVPHEVTTFREDVETFGRHAVVAYATDVREDARRRDFTMNALYARPDGEIVDPLGGLPDLLARRVRFIEDPYQRIREDYLRILRFFRFHARYGDPAGGLDPEGLAAAADLADGLSALSRERIGHEMRKLLAAPDPAPSVAAMRQAGVLARILPGAHDRALGPLVHLERQWSADPECIRRLAALGGDETADLLRLSKAEARRLDILRTQATASTPPHELGYRFGVEAGRDILLLRAAFLEQALPEGAQSALEKGATAVFPLEARDLMPDYQGPSLGARLQELEQRWIESRFSLGREVLLASDDGQS